MNSPFRSEQDRQGFIAEKQLAATSKYDFKRAGIVGLEVQSMAEDNMNSERYWENRFVANDWEKYDGGKTDNVFLRILHEKLFQIGLQESSIAITGQ